MYAKTKLTAIFVFLALATGVPAAAHNPRIVPSGGGTVAVQNPEISQAFYGRLEGVSQRFEINSAKDFVLYVNILVPKLPDSDTGLIVNIYKEENSGQNLLAKLDGENFKWTEFYEPFGGDYYLKGPEYRADAGAGKYLIEVTHCIEDAAAVSSDTADKCAFLKYSLAIGEKESFPPGEILNTILILPVLKKDFFGRSPLAAYFNYTGLFLLGIAAIFISFLFLIYYFFSRRFNV